VICTDWTIVVSRRGRKRHERTNQRQKKTEKEKEIEKGPSCFQSRTSLRWTYRGYFSACRRDFVMAEWYPIGNIVNGNVVSNRRYGLLLIGPDTHGQSSNRDQVVCWRNNFDATDGIGDNLAPPVLNMSPQRNSIYNHYRKQNGCWN